MLKLPLMGVSPVKIEESGGWSRAAPTCAVGWDSAACTKSWDSWQERTSNLRHQHQQSPLVTCYVHRQCLVAT
jgi:hypothetical protein